jgi:hypothetical protein
VKRRNRYEVRIAAAQALFWASAGITAVQRPYHQVLVPEAPELPGAKQIRREAKARLRDRRQLKMVMRGRRDLIADEEADVLSELEGRRQQLNANLNSVRSQFAHLDPLITGIVFNTVLADNLFPARWLGLVDGVGLVVVAFGSPSEMVWPEEADVGDSGSMKVKKVAKRFMLEEHMRMLLRALMATGKEVLSANPQLRQVRVVAIDRSGPEKLGERNVWGELTLGQRDLRHLNVTSTNVERVARLEQQWLNADGEISDEDEWYFFTSLLTSYRDLLIDEGAVMQELADRLKGKMKPTSREVVPSGTLSMLLEGDPESLRLIAGSGRGLAGTSGEQSVNDLQFWLDVIAAAKSKK